MTGKNRTSESHVMIYIQKPASLEEAESYGHSGKFSK